MKHLVHLLVSIVLIMSTSPVMAVEQKLELPRLSLYSCQSIREEDTKGEKEDCDCIGLCECTFLYHILNDNEEDFYSAFFNGDYLGNPIGTIYQDCSASMEETFCYERSKIIKNLSTYLNEEGKEIEDVFKNKKTNLYGLLKSSHKDFIPKEIYTIPSGEPTPVVITDLWDTAGKEETFIYEGEIIFCVPYESSNKEGVIHCEEVVNNILWNHSAFPGTICIYVIYMDEVIVRYSNGFYVGDEGFIRIYTP